MAHRTFTRSLVGILAFAAGIALPATASGSPTFVFDTLLVGSTYWDNQPNRTTTRQIVVDTSGRVHMAWVFYPAVYGPPEGELYNSFAGGVLSDGSAGCQIGLHAAGGYQGWDMVSMGVDTVAAIVVKNIDKAPNIYRQLPGPCSWSPYSFASMPGANNPHFAVQRTYGSPMYHMLAVGNTGLIYWRTPLGSSYRIVESAAGENTIATSPISNKVAIVYEFAGNVYYYESHDAGATWGGGPGFGLRHDLGQTDAGNALSAVYDYNDSLHIVFEAVTGDTPPVTFRHWSAASGATDVVSSPWVYTGMALAQQRNLNHPQLGVGIGSRLNSLYLVWDQVGTALSGADTSAAGKLNADIYLSISVNGGRSWDPARNITNSASPGCAGDCKSEVYPWIAEQVDSVIHILFLRDLEAGPAHIFSDPVVTGPRTNNPVYYMRIPTPDIVLAPVMVGTPGKIGPRYFGVVRVDTVTASISNVGTAPLEYTFSDTMNWLRFAGNSDSQSGQIDAGGASQPVQFILDATGLPDGTYTGTVSIASNDPSVNGGRISVEMRVSENIVAVYSFGTSGGTECWGWTGPNGDEYAIMGVYAGVAFVDATTHRVIDVVPGPGPCGATWREMKTYGHYCYVVSECNGPREGMMIIDMQYLPDSAHYVGSYFTASDVRSHNISIDTAKGIAYLVRQNYNGFRVVSLANPVAPVEISHVTINGAYGCHDMYARNDTVWVAEGGNGSFSIWNMANKNTPQLIARISIPNAGFVHNIWPSADAHYVVTTEETVGKTVKIWDTHILGNVQLVGEYLGPCQLAHNALIRGHSIVLSHYQSGVRIIDFSTPSSPTEVGAYDTYPQGEGSAFEGCWGVYPFTHSGNVYASNLNGNLFILRFANIPGCACPCAGDPQCDSVTNVLDVVQTVNVAFRAATAATDPDCPREHSDVDCSGVTDILDVVKIVNVAFRAANASTEFCSPCTP